MFLPSILFFFVASQLVKANQKCPENLSQNCNCEENPATVQCKFDINDTVELFNSSIIKQSLFNFTKLDISKNNLSNLPHNFLDGIYNLFELDLSENNFQNLPSILQPGLAAKIKKFNISHNLLTNIDQSMFTSTTTLEVLDISSNKLNDFKGNAFTNNKYMWYLDVSNNNLHTLSVSSFKGLENSIREMDLSWNNLSILEKNIFSNLHDLQILRLSGNQNFGKISDIDLPRHVALLDLSFTGINDVEDCLFFELIDLEYLNLQGNSLRCSCHLAWLNQRILHNQEINHMQRSQNNDWTCVNPQGIKFNTSDLHIDCSGHHFLNVPDHCQNSEEKDVNFNEKKWKENLNLKIEKESDGISLKWNRYNSSGFIFYGYEITIFDENSRKIYTSPILHISARKYSAATSEIHTGKYKICLNILHNETQIIGSACNELSYIDLQIIVGILAGIIFLIPCVVALVYIMYLDKRKFLQYSVYSELSKSKKEKNVENPKMQNTEKKENNAKWTKVQNKKEGLNVPKITVQDYTLTNTRSTDNILPHDQDTILVVHSSDRILPDDQVSIEPDGDSGSSAGIRIDIPSDNESGITNEGYAEDNTKVFDIRL